MSVHLGGLPPPPPCTKKLATLLLPASAHQKSGQMKMADTVPPPPPHSLHEIAATASVIWCTPGVRIGAGAFQHLRKSNC